MTLISTSFQTGNFFVDVDLDHDGHFTQGGELGYAEGDLNRSNAVKLVGLVAGNYELRGRMEVAGQEYLTPLAHLQIVPPTADRLPVSFEPNLGQTDGSVLFIGRAQNQTVFLTATETVLQSRSTDGSETSTTRFRLAGANPDALPMGTGLLPSISNYFKGNDPGLWQTNVPNYQRLVAAEVYPGIDMIYHSSENHLEFDFVVAPGADPSIIALEYPDAVRVAIDDEGALVIHQADGTVARKAAPILYQERDGALVTIKGAWVVRSQNTAGYYVGAYDTSRPLTIDPLVFSTFLGGSGLELYVDIATDSAGNVYVSGSTYSTDFPTVVPIQATALGDREVFVSKFDPTGTTLVYSTYLSGSNIDLNSERDHGIAVDSQGNAIVTGASLSTDFPIVNAVQSTRSGGETCFITKLNATGTALIFSTYWGSSSSRGRAIAVDSTDAIYVAGRATTVVTTPGAYVTTPGSNGFITKFTPAGTVIYSSYLGLPIVAHDIAVFGDRAIVMGEATMPMATTPGAIQSVFGGGLYDVGVMEFNSAGSGLVFATLLGGDGDEKANSVATDSFGNVYLAFKNRSTNLPITLGAALPTPVGPAGAIAKINPTGTALLFLNYLGDEASDVVVDAGGNVYVTGFANIFTSNGNPPLVNSFQGTAPPGFNAYLSIFDPTGSTLVMSSLLGGVGGDYGIAMALDPAGNVVLTGTTGSADFLTLNPYQATYGGGGDIYITKYDPYFAVVSQAGGTNLAEGGATDSYTLELNRVPSANVVLTLTPDSQVAISAAVLTFTPANWNVRQTVTVTALDDLAIEGAHTGLITGTINSADTNFNALDVPIVSASITDNDFLQGVNIAQSAGSTDVAEGGATDQYTIVLNSQPTANVIITLSTSPQYAANPALLTFTPANWSTLRTITVSAVNDFVVEGPHSGIVTHSVTSADTNYNGIASATVSVFITDNDAAGLTLTPSGGSNNVSEAGLADTYTVALSSQPTGNVIIGLVPGTQLSVNPGTLTFTSATWNLVQTVTVTAVDDAVIEGFHAGSIVHTAASSDANYNLSGNAAVNITDNDFAQGVIVTPSAGTTDVSEAGLSDSYTIVLNSAPIANVIITVNPGLQLNVLPTPLTFTPANWNVAQTLFVQAVDDAIAQGTRNQTITHTATSTDPLYNAIAVASVTVNITDNDTAGITFSTLNVDLSEGGSSNTYTVVLNTQPTANVILALAGDSQVSLAVSTLVFTPGNWNVPQTIRVSAIDDTLAEGLHSGLITHTAASADPGYSGITRTITARINDNENPGVLISQTNGPITILEGSSKTYTAVLNSPPSTDVVLNINPDPQVSVSPASITFTPSDWNVPRPVVVTASDDGIEEGDHLGRITHTTTSGSAAFNNLTVAGVMAHIVDNDGSAVFGTERADQILVSFTPANIKVTVNGRITTLPSTLTQLLLFAGFGNDSIQITAPTIPVVVVGGPGVDKVFVTGQAAANNFVLGDSVVTVNGQGIGIWETEALTVGGRASNDVFTVQDVPTFPVELKGDAGTDVIIGPDRPNTWQITGSNSGTLDSSIKLSTVENVTGGASADSFVFAAGKSLTGRVDGGAGTNTLDLAAYTATVMVNLQTSVATGSKSFTGIDTIVGGKGAADKIIGADQANVWNITSANAGSVNGLAFRNFENLTGGAQDDAYVLADGQGVKGKIDGAAGLDVLDFTAYLSRPVAINLQTKTATSTGGFANLEQFQGGSGTSDTLIGLNKVNLWNLAGLGAGDVAGQAFGNFENLTGGSLVDIFTLAGGGDWLGSINGATGQDILQAFPGNSVWTTTGLNAGTLNGRKFLGIEIRR